MNQLPGKLIVFEGVEGCGKTTQSELLSKYFYDNQIDHLLVREPGGTETGEKIRSILVFFHCTVAYFRGLQPLFPTN